MLKSIGFRLTLILLFVVLLGIGITVGVAVSISSNAITRESLDKVEQATGRGALQMDGWLSYQKSSINTVADMLPQDDDFSLEHLEAVFEAVMNDNDAFFDVYFGFESDFAGYEQGFAIAGSRSKFDYSWWHAHERGWYKLALTDTSKTHITEPYVDATTGELCITAAKAVMRNGELLGVVAADIFVTTLQNMVHATTLGQEGYAILLDSNGDIFVHPDSSLEPDMDDNYINITSVDNGVYTDLWKQIAAADKMVKYNSDYYTVNTLDSTGWRLMTVLPTKVVSQPITTVILTVIPLAIIILILTAILVLLTIRNVITRPIVELVGAADRLAGGDTKVQIKTGYQGEMGLLAASFTRMIESSGEQARQIERLAGGDLTVEAHPRGAEDTLGNSLVKLCDNLNATMANIRSSINQVTAGSMQIADSSQVVAQGSAEQTASIEQLTAGIDVLTGSIMLNSERAERAAALSASVKENAETGNTQMEQMLLAVKEINDAGRSIERIIKVIDDIAFQTNILALNAAVEAARAGQHGKGFAVVAEEVRNLAGKSAEAARDTGELITNSVEKAALGARIAEATSASLRGIVEGITQSTEIVDEIAVSGSEQAASIDKIHRGILQVSDVVHKNSASAQESAAASEEMSGQANLLEDLAAQFKLRDAVPKRQMTATQIAISKQY